MLTTTDTVSLPHRRLIYRSVSPDGYFDFSSAEIESIFILFLRFCPPHTMSEEVLEINSEKLFSCAWKREKGCKREFYMHLLS
jgi:hypothetical protein